MRSDLDQLMEKHGLDVLFVFGGEAPSPIRTYLLGGKDITGNIFKKRGEPLIFYTNILEKENAEKAGLRTFTGFDFGQAELQKEFRNDVAGLRKALLTRVFEQLGLAGRLALVGTADVAETTWLVSRVLPTIPAIELVSDYELTNFIEGLYATKDDDEIAKLRDVGERSGAVVAATWDFIAGHHADVEGVIADAAGTPLTVGKVKQFIRMRNFEQGLENADGMIFAPEREGATGHGEGKDDHVLRWGETIVFDYFPRSVNTGYFHDMTRTWALGAARPEVQKAYDLVLNSFNICIDTLQPGTDGSRYQNLVNDLYEANGHKTSRANPGTQEGYIHSLGHGLGLNIHEMPAMRNFPYGPKLEIGSAFTIEPGLYYPDQNFGVRVEDTVYFDKNGVLQTLTDFKYDLVLPLRRD